MKTPEPCALGAGTPDIARLLGRDALISAGIGLVIGVPLALAGVGGIPASGVSAVLLNVTSIGGGGGGYLIVFPGQATAPNASMLNPVTIPAFNFWGSSVSQPGSANAGTIGVFSTAPLDVAIDVVGYFR